MRATYNIIEFEVKMGHPNKYSGGAGFWLNEPTAQERGLGWGNRFLVLLWHLRL